MTQPYFSPSFACIISTLIFIASIVGSVSAFYEVLREKSSKFYIVNHRYKTYQILPDQETAEEFGYVPSNLTKIMDAVSTAVPAHYFFIEKPIISLKFADTKNGHSRTPDERMRNYVQRVLALEPCNFWVWSHKIHVSSDMANPSIVLWNDHGMVIAYRESIWDKKDYHFEWLQREPATDHFFVSANVTKLGFGGLIGSGHLNSKATQYDCRIVTFNSSMVASCAYSSGPATYQVGQYKIDVDRNNGKAVVFENAELMMHENLTLSGTQKNWVPFVYKSSRYEQRLYYIQSINPFHVVEFDSLHKVVKTVSLQTEIHLPWRGEFGLPLRGGTPAILVNGVYLGLFHTMCMFKAPYKLRTYFMGAFTFCRSIPFQLHSVSMFPFIREAFYNSEWVSNFLDYAIFPTGILLDADGKHILVSMGVQDKEGWVIKMEIEGLLRSLDVVSNCSYAY